MTDKYIGIELSHGFGDALFGIPLIEALCAKHNKQAIIFSNRRHADAFIGVPCIKTVCHIDNMGEGQHTKTMWSITAINALENDTPQDMCNINVDYQITPQFYFNKFKQEDPNHSLLNTITTIGHQYCDVNIDPRPKIYLSRNERDIAAQYCRRLHGPIVAIEAEYLSSQSWTQDEDFEYLIKQHPHYNFLWLSLRPPRQKFPNLRHVATKYSRRECIAMLNYVQLFVSVGSGLFCASLTADVNPPITQVLWIDQVYKYKDIINKSGWSSNISWIDNKQQWQVYARIPA